MLCEKVVYVGRLDGFTASDRLSLSGRVRSLLLLQYSSVSSDSKIESKAMSIVGKLHSKSMNDVASGISSSMGGDLSVAGEDVQIRLNSLIHERHYEIGCEWLCSQAISELGLLDYLLTLGWSKESVGYFELCLLSRLIHRGSERSSVNWLEESSGSLQLQTEALPINKDQLYKISKQTLASKTEIESYLYSQLATQHRKADKQDCLCYYDLSNVYFEGRMQGSQLCEFGASKEKRMNQPLVSYSLLTNQAGFIKHSDFYSGNVYEAHTFQDAIQQLDKSQVFVCDSGITTEEHIEWMLVNEYQYICVARRGFQEFEVDFDSPEVVELEHQCSNGYAYQVWLTHRVHQIEIDGKEYIEHLLFVKSEGKQAKEDGIINKQKKRFEEGLQKIQASLTKPRGHKKISQVYERLGKLKAKNGKVNKAFSIEIKKDNKIVSELKWTYNPDHEKRNGTYVIRTTEAITDVKKTWEKYRSLTKIEAVNRCLKTDLKIRPVYHQKDESIKAHFFLAFIAANVIQHIRTKLAQQEINYSWERILQLMNQQKTTITTFSNQHNQWFWVCQWSKANQKVSQIYQALQYQEKAHNGFFFQVQNRTT